MTQNITRLQSKSYFLVYENCNLNLSIIFEFLKSIGKLEYIIISCESVLPEVLTGCIFSIWPSPFLVMKETTPTYISNLILHYFYILQKTKSI